MKPYAKQFYGSTAWKATRKAYASSKGCLCERCLSKGIIKEGEIVHHKVHLTPYNINNPDITLSFDNLELLCRECHAEEHEAEMKRKTSKRYIIDEQGRVITK